MESDTSTVTKQMMNQSSVKYALFINRKNTFDVVEIIRNVFDDVYEFMIGNEKMLARTTNGRFSIGTLIMSFSEIEKLDVFDYINSKLEEKYGDGYDEQIKRLGWI